MPRAAYPPGRDGARGRAQPQAQHSPTPGRGALRTPTGWALALAVASGDTEPWAYSVRQPRRTGAPPPWVSLNLAPRKLPPHSAGEKLLSLDWASALMKWEDPHLGAYKLYCPWMTKWVPCLLVFHLFSWSVTSLLMTVLARVSHFTRDWAPKVHIWAGGDTWGPSLVPTSPERPHPVHADRAESRRLGLLCDPGRK